MLRSPMSLRGAARTALLLLLAPLSLAGQQHAHEAGPSGSSHGGLGSLDFPTSGASAAQPAFERGVLLMHSFEYAQAAEAFREAAEIDPDFAMAYWGEAMTHNHPVWNEQDRDAALAVLARYAPTPAARAARAPTPRERAWLEAVDVLYGEGSKAQRDTLYERAMEALSQAYPDDDEARAFHALAILGLSRGDRDVPSYMRAGAVALDLFQRNPDHPGAAHYVIHAFDDPTHAPLGLAAADAYAEIAPAAAHAQHMTTHIFLALGMWDRVVESNIRADAVVDAGRAQRGLSPTDCGHYNQWLAYGHAQQGRVDEARALVMACMREAGEAPALAGGAEGMRALYVAGFHDEAPLPADDPVATAELARPGGVDDAAWSGVRLTQHWTAGWVAAARGDAARARQHLEAFEAALHGPLDLPEWTATYRPVWHGTLRAVVAAAEGNTAEALEVARAAAEAEAALPVDFGPPISYKPARELEGDLLLAAGQASEALAAYRLALERTPRRASALRGFAAAAEAAGETTLARDARAELAAMSAATTGAGG
jgi:tetratricopeptide (TPR) repeat protein